MADQGWMMKIAQALRGGAPAQQPGLQQAAQGMDPAYRQHVIDAMASGQAPMSREEFMVQGHMPPPVSTPDQQPAQEAPAKPFRF